MIAAVNGFAYGGGLELAMACDIRLASSSAAFAAPEIKLGWIGGSGQSALLAHNVGPSNAALMLLTGDPVDAAQALAWGLVSEQAVRYERDLQTFCLSTADAAEGRRVRGAVPAAVHGE